MSIPILATKLFVPPPGKILVDRSRLVNRLNESLHPACRLALVSAPAGFGKTTLLSAWALGCGQPVTWLTIDEGDNDPFRFLAYLVAAAKIIDPDHGQNILEAMQSPQHAPLGELMQLLVNRFGSISGQFVLVLDDYHLITSPEIHKTLTFLIEHQPSQMLLVIATRKDPPLPIPLLRARGQLTELRQADLRFNLDEATAFLKQGMEFELSVDMVDSLVNRTEGWAAGLQMAALSIRDKKDASRLIANFSGGHEYIVDYFAAEVLAQQPEPQKTFLMQTSILDQLCGPLCDEVTAQTEGQQTLERLRQANLFVIDLDNDRCWYRYHRLFRDLLQKQLRQHTPKLIPELHRRASGWYERNGLMDGAIDHALIAGDFGRAENLISQTLAESFWRHGESITTLRWLAALPEERVVSQPDLCVFHALALFLAGQLDKAEARLKTAEQLLEAKEEQSPANGRHRAEQMGMIAAVRAYIAYFQGDGPAIVKYARQVLALLPEENAMWRNSAAINLGDAYSISGDLEAAQQAYTEALKTSQAAGNLFLSILAGSKLAVTLKEQGHYRRAEQICQQLLQMADANGRSQTEMTGRVYAVWGDILCEWNELDRAEAILRKAVGLCLQEGNVASLGLSYLYLLRVFLARQNDSAMQETLHHLEKLELDSSVPVWISKGIVAWKSWIWIIQGKLDAAAQLLNEHVITADGELDFRSEGEYLSLTRLMIAQGRPADAVLLVDRLYSAAGARGRSVWAIVLLSMRALAAEAQGMHAAATASLERALVLAEEEGFIRIFIEAGPTMARLIHEVAGQGVASHYTSRLLAAFSAHSSQQAGQPSRADNLIEPLSKRELNVLDLLAEGLSNKQIATQLCLSLSTVKFHTSNIYGKLGVKSRTEALARARNLGLLSS